MAKKTQPAGRKSPGRTKSGGKRKAAKGKKKPATTAATGTPRGDRRKPAAEQLSSAADSGKAGFAVVGIGASAGGLDAYRQFFAAMPADSGLAFVLIQHLDPTHQSLTAELLNKQTAMPVVEARDEMAVEANHVYVIPPNRYMAISGEALRLTEPVEPRGTRLPIDFFFRSLADDRQERAIGIIFSGAGTDGTLGAREIKAGGGMVMVQSPEFAQCDGMPRSAISTGVVDHVLAIEDMPDVLIRYVQHSYVNGTAVPATDSQEVPDQLNAVIGLLRVRLKYDFSGYKKGTLTRRVQRRMGLNHIADMGNYAEKLRNSEEELAALYKDLLIGVTNFFREPEAWKDLEKLVIDPLIDARPNDQPIRVWVPGCTTGEEPYSLAMLLFERLLAKGKQCPVQIFASDIDRDALAFARTGVYPENIAADVTADRLRQFFVKGEHTYRINKEVRDLVVFAEQNVISDPPFSKLDLISCRNLLIYLESEIQQKLLSMFHFALHEGSWLFLGNAETVNQQHDLFETVSRKWRIYRRIGPVRAATIDFPATIRPLPRLAPEGLPHGGVRRMSHVSAVAQMAILQRYAPACVLVNRKMEVVYLHGSVDEYLQLPAGELASDVIAMSRPGLRAKLRSSIQQAIAERKPVTVENVRIKRGEKYHAIRLSVEPLRDVDKTDGLLLVAFDEASAANRVRIVYVEPRDVRRPDIPETTDEFEIVIRQLEEELRGTKEDLQTSIEELETSNEEFKAANEEVTSINEELQSTNEELETSKEELQSMNEELHTVNSQLEQKVMELESMTSDLTNLLASTDIATIFLDRQFRLRWFSPAATRLLRVIETDVGRPIRDFAHSFRDNSLLTDAGLVLQRLTPIEDEVQDEEQTWYLRRIAPYRTGDHRIDGVVITFTDISQRKSHETSLRELAEKLEQRVTERTEQLADAHAALKVTETRFRALLEATPDPLILLDADGTTLQINRETEKLFGYTRVEVVGQAIDVLIPERYRGQYETYRASYFRHPAPRSASIGMELAIRCKDGSELPVEVQLNPVEIDGQTLIITALRKVTSRKAAQPE